MWGQKGGGAQTYHCPQSKKWGDHMHPLPPPPTPASYASDIYMYIYVCVSECYNMDEINCYGLLENARYTSKSPSNCKM